MAAWWLLRYTNTRDPGVSDGPALLANPYIQAMGSQRDALWPTDYCTSTSNLQWRNPKQESVPTMREKSGYKPALVTLGKPWIP
eukprot:1255523-Heterocapsa_arctica.AAC.1